MKQYLDLMRHVRDHGVERGDRTGTGTLAVFGHQMRFDLSDGFPLVTTKKLHLRSIIHELLWFLSGDSNIRYLKDNGVSIWDSWADENGELGPGVRSAMAQLANARWGQGRPDSRRCRSHSPQSGIPTYSRVCLERG